MTRINILIAVAGLTALADADPCPHPVMAPLVERWQAAAELTLSLLEQLAGHTIAMDVPESRAEVEAFIVDSIAQLRRSQAAYRRGQSG